MDLKSSHISVHHVCPADNTLISLPAPPTAERSQGSWPYLGGRGTAPDGHWWGGHTQFPQPQRGVRGGLGDQKHPVTTLPTCSLCNRSGAQGTVAGNEKQGLRSKPLMGLANCPSRKSEAPAPMRFKCARPMPPPPTGLFPQLPPRTAVPAVSAATQHTTNPSLERILTSSNQRRNQDIWWGDDLYLIGSFT